MTKPPDGVFQSQASRMRKKFGIPPFAVNSFNFFFFFSIFSPLTGRDEQGQRMSGSPAAKMLLTFLLLGAVGADVECSWEGLMEQCGQDKRTGDEPARQLASRQPHRLRTLFCSPPLPAAFDNKAGDRARQHRSRCRQPAGGWTVGGSLSPVSGMPAPFFFSLSMHAVRPCGILGPQAFRLPRCRVSIESGLQRESHPIYDVMRLLSWSFRFRVAANG